MLEDIQKLCDTIFEELEEYLKINSNYSPYIFQNEPEDKLFPLVVVKQNETEGTYTTLNYADYIYPIKIKINVYATQKSNISNVTICNELCDLIENFFQNVYRMKVKTNRNVENIDTNVHRALINISCRVDTKYKDKLIIYPN